jgi:hypothetical protein
MKQIRGYDRKAKSFFLKNEQKRIFLATEMEIGFAFEECVERFLAAHKLSFKTESEVAKKYRVHGIDHLVTAGDTLFLLQEKWTKKIPPYSNFIASISAIKRLESDKRIIPVLVSRRSCHGKEDFKEFVKSYGLRHVDGLTAQTMMRNLWDFFRKEIAGFPMFALTSDEVGEMGRKINFGESKRSSPATNLLPDAPKATPKTTPPFDPTKIVSTTSRIVPVDVFQFVPSKPIFELDIFEDDGRKKQKPLPDIFGTVEEEPGCLSCLFRLLW